MRRTGRREAFGHILAADCARPPLIEDITRTARPCAGAASAACSSLGRGIVSPRGTSIALQTRCTFDKPSALRSCRDSRPAGSAPRVGRPSHLPLRCRTSFEWGSVLTATRPCGGGTGSLPRPGHGEYVWSRANRSGVGWAHVAETRNVPERPVQRIVQCKSCVEFSSQRFAATMSDSCAPVARKHNAGYEPVVLARGISNRSV